MRGRLHLVAVVAALVLVPGCVTLSSAPAPAPAPTAADAPEDADAGPVNRFLLEAPRPYGTRVSGGAEPSILASRDGTTVWIGDTAGIHRSQDGGVSWQRLSDPFVGGLFTDGWAMAEDDVGRLYVVVTNGQAISLAVSGDKGTTWEHVNHLVDFSGVADRPWVAARGDGEVAVIFYDAVRTTREVCVRSDDAGRTFLVRHLNNVNVYPNAGNAAYGPDGALYYATGAMTYQWARACEDPFKRMPHGSATGAQIFTQVSVDAAGDVYVARPSADNSQVVLSGTHGMVGGTRKTLVVSPPELASNTFVTLSAGDGEVVVAWYGSETAGNPSDPGFAGAWNVYVARVSGFWTDSPAVTYARLTTEPNHVGDFCMSGVTCGVGGGGGDRDLLDYFMVDHAPDGGVHVAYGHDGTGSRAEVRYARLPAP